MEKIRTHTSCKSCYFADYNGKTQVGCLLGRVDKYRDLGCLVEVYDDDSEFFVIDGRLCHAKRPVEWAAGKQPLVDIHKELFVRVDCLIYIDNSEYGLWDSLEYTVQNLSRLQDPFNSIYFINNSSVPVRELHTYLMKAAKDLPWNLTDILEENASIWRCVDNVFSKLTGHFYSLWEPGIFIPENFVTKINKALNEDLLRFVALEPFESISDDVYNGLTIQNGFHKSSFICGNRTMAYGDPENEVQLTTVLEKAKFLDPNMVLQCQKMFGRS